MEKNYHASQADGIFGGLGLHPLLGIIRKMPPLVAWCIKLFGDFSRLYWFACVAFQLTFCDFTFTKFRTNDFYSL